MGELLSKQRRERRWFYTLLQYYYFVQRVVWPTQYAPAHASGDLYKEILWTLTVQLIPCSVFNCPLPVV